MTFMEQWNRITSYEPEPGERFLTVYLHIPSSTGPRPEWVIRLKNGLKKLTEYAEAGDDRDALKQLLKLKGLVEKEAESRQPDMKNGLFVVAGSSGNLFAFVNMQTPLPNSFYWEDRPMLEEMEQVMEQFPSAGIVQVGSESVTVIDTELAEVRREYNFEWDPESEDWRPYVGLAGPGRKASSSTHRDRFLLRLEANRQRWMQRLLPVLDRFQRQKRWKEILFIGEKPLAQELANQVRFPKKQVIGKNLNGASPHAVLDEVFGTRGG